MTTATQQDWAKLGRQAHADGRLSVPMADPAVAAAIEHLPVGGGAAEIMRAWTDGWHAANLAAWDDAGPVDDGPVDGADTCADGCDPARLRVLNRFEDECADCGRTGPTDDPDQLNV